MNEDNNKNLISQNIKTYEQKLAKLQQLVQQIEAKDNSFSQLLDNMQTANQLVKNCRSQLRNIEQDILPQK